MNLLGPLFLTDSRGWLLYLIMFFQILHIGIIWDIYIRILNWDSKGWSWEIIYGQQHLQVIYMTTREPWLHWRILILNRKCIECNSMANKGTCSLRVKGLIYWLMQEWLLVNNLNKSFNNYVLPTRSLVIIIMFE